MCLDLHLLLSVFSFCFCYSDKHNDQKLLGKERLYFILHFQVSAHHRGKTNRNLKRDLNETTKKCSCLFSDASSLALFCNSGPFARGGTTHSGLGHPTSVNKQNMSWTCLQGSVGWRHLSVEVPSSQVTLVLY